MSELIQKANDELASEIKDEVRKIHLKKVDVVKGIKTIQTLTGQLKQEHIYNTNRAIGAGVVGAGAGWAAGPWMNEAASYMPGVGPIFAALSQSIGGLGGHSISASLGAVAGFFAPREGLEAAGFQLVSEDVTNYFTSLYNLLLNPNVYRGLANNGLMLIVDEANKSK